MKKKTKIDPLPFFIYFWSVVAIALVGLADALYLAVAHYRNYTDMGYKSFCAVSKSINCDTVSQSSFSIFLDVPVPIWGIVGYAAFLLLLYPARHGPSDRGRLWPLLFVMATCFSAYSIVLAAISVFYIHSYCIMCIISYAVNFALMYFTWLIHSRFADVSLYNGIAHDIMWVVNKHKRAVLILFCAVLCVSGALVLWMPHYWEFSDLNITYDLPNGVTDDGHPWIGAEYPKLVIVEFADYQCFQCKKMHFYLREIMTRYPDTIRLVHRHFPMDNAYNSLLTEPFHVGSGKMALISLFAAEKNKFWEVSDMLFDIDVRAGHFNLKGIAGSANLDIHELARSISDPELINRLRADIRDGLKLGITATPGYLINGKVYLGHVPPEIFDILRK